MIFRLLRNCVDLSEDESSDVYWLQVSFGRIQMEIACDTGAPRTFVPKAFYDKHLSRFPIEQCKIPYTGYGWHKLNLIGECYPSITYRGTSRVITVVVTNANAPPLLGRNFLRTFGFLLLQKNHVYSIDSVDSQAHPVIVNQIKDEFSNLFDGKMGKYNVCEISLAIDSNAKPIFCKPRALPFAWKETIERNLRELVEKGVLEQIESSQWGTPLVPIPKPDGDLRICGDYKITINKFLVDVKYPLPLIEEIFSNLQGGELYSKLDMCAAYNQLCLNAESQLLCAWSTHIGTFKMLRLPFGVKPAAAIFQMQIENLLRSICGVVVYQDDITVTGKTFKEHIFNLKTVLKRMSDAGLKLNLKKCVFFQKQISYLGFTIDKN